jgi:hypothetical protein
MNKEQNPFISVGYRGPEYFCDREEESKQLDDFMKQGVHVTLFAIRRLGKTGLIQHVFYPHRNSKTVHCIYLDILSTGKLSDLVNQLATAIYNRFPEKSSIGKKMLELLMSFRPVISFDELTGNPSLSLKLESRAQQEQSIHNLFQFLDQQGGRIVFAIDEFQQILTYPEKNTEAILRTTMQQLTNTSFIFSGSNQKMMHEIFNSAKRPFFASCTNMQLDYIPKAAYSKFIHKKFKAHKRSITQESVDFICQWTKRHTFFTQHLSAAVFMQEAVAIDIEQTRMAALRILKLNEPNFYQYKNLLTSAQWNLLCALAQEEQVTQPTAKKFINQHKLGTPSLVKRGLEALLHKELIYYNSSVEQPYYEVYDKFLMRWIQHTQR